MSEKPDKKGKNPKQLPDSVIIEAMYRYKVVLADAVAKCGGQARYISQHAILWQTSQKEAGFDKDFHLGVCAGLAIEWIKARKAGQDFIGQLTKIRNEVMTKKSGQAEGWEDFVERVTDSHYRQKQLHAALKDFEQQGEPERSPYPYKGIGKLLKAGCYHYISSGSHAMAAFFEGGKVEFYDPNIGEVTGTSPAFLEAYFAAVVQVSAAILGIKPEDKPMTITVFKP